MDSNTGFYMSVWRGFQQVLASLFLKGNYRWYILFIPFAFVSFFNAIFWIVGMNLIITGNTISTDTFVAQMSSGVNISKLSLDIIGWLFSRLAEVTLIFGVWLVISICADIGYGIFWVYRRYIG
jgi:hypothetical protein